MKCCGARSLSAFLRVQYVLQASCSAVRCKLCMSSKELFKYLFLKSKVGTESLQTENPNYTLYIVSCSPIGTVRL